MLKVLAWISRRGGGSSRCSRRSPAGIDGRVRFTARSARALEYREHSLDHEAGRAQRAHDAGSPAVGSPHRGSEAACLRSSRVRRTRMVPSASTPAAPENKCSKRFVMGNPARALCGRFRTRQRFQARRRGARARFYGGPLKSLQRAPGGPAIAGALGKGDQQARLQDARYRDRGRIRRDAYRRLRVVAGAPRHWAGVRRRPHHGEGFFTKRA